MTSQTIEYPPIPPPIRRENAIDSHVIDWKAFILNHTNHLKKINTDMTSETIEDSSLCRENAIEIPRRENAIDINDFLLDHDIPCEDNTLPSCFDGPFETTFQNYQINKMISSKIYDNDQSPYEFISQDGGSIPPGLKLVLSKDLVSFPSAIEKFKSMGPYKIYLEKYYINITIQSYSEISDFDQYGKKYKIIEIWVSTI